MFERLMHLIDQEIASTKNIILMGLNDLVAYREYVGELRALEKTKAMLKQAMDETDEDDDGFLDPSGS